MKNLPRLINSYTVKIAEYSNYQRVLELKQAVAEFKDETPDTKDKSVADAVISKLNVLASMIYNYGITAAVSAKYKNEIAAKLNELNARSVSIKTALDKYTPSNIGSIKLADLPAGEPQIPHLAPKFELPKSQDELETWPTSEPEKKEDGTIEIPTTEISAEPPKEEPKFNFHPKPGASGFVPGSDAPTFNVEPIVSLNSKLQDILKKY